MHAGAGAVMENPVAIRFKRAGINAIAETTDQKVLRKQFGKWNQAEDSYKAYGAKSKNRIWIHCHSG